MGTVVYRALAAVITFIYTILVLNVFGTAPEDNAAVTIENYTAPSAQTVTLSIMQSQNNVSQSLQQAADMFNQANSGTKITVQTVSGQAEYSVALRAKLLSGEQLDIFNVFGRRDLMDIFSHASDISDLEWIGSAPSWTVDAVKVDKGIYGIPYSVEGVGMIINRKMFEAAGIYVGDIGTLEALEDLFKELMQSIESGELAEDFPKLEAVTEFGAQDKRYLTDVISNLALNGSFDSAETMYESKYVDIPLSEAFKELVRIMALYSTCAKWEQLNHVTQVQQLENGIASERIAVTIQNASSYNRILAANPEMWDSLRFLPIPMGIQTFDSAIYTGVSCYWCINADSSEESTEIARQFLTWLYNSDSGQDMLSAKFGIISPFSLKIGTGNPFYPAVIRQIESGASAIMLHNDEPSNWGQEVFASGLQAYLAKELTWDDYMQLCKEEWNKMQNHTLLMQ